MRKEESRQVRALGVQRREKPRETAIQTPQDKHFFSEKQLFLLQKLQEETLHYLTQSNNVFFIVEVCRLNTVILKCFRIIQTMTKWTYFLINFCRLNTHSTLIITKLAGSTHRVRIAGFQRREGGEIIFFFFNHIAIDLLRATAEMLQANNLHPLRKDKLRKDR